MKNRGPGKEPFSMPQICLKASDLESSIWTNSFLSWKYSVVRYPLMGCPSDDPHASNFDSTIVWSRVSKAFDKSRNIPAKYFWQSMTLLATLVTKLIKAWEVHVEWPGQKPNWCC